KWAWGGRAGPPKCCGGYTSTRTTSWWRRWTRKPARRCPTAPPANWLGSLYPRVHDRSAGEHVVDGGEVQGLFEPGVTACGEQLGCRAFGESVGRLGDGGADADAADARGR